MGRRQPVVCTIGSSTRSRAAALGPPQWSTALSAMPPTPSHAPCGRLDRWLVGRVALGVIHHGLVLRRLGGFGAGLCALPRGKPGRALGGRLAGAARVSRLAQSTYHAIVLDALPLGVLCPLLLHVSDLGVDLPQGVLCTGMPAGEQRQARGTRTMR